MNVSRKQFFGFSGAFAASAALGASTADKVKKIDGFDEKRVVRTGAPWKPFSDRKVRVGIAGYGVCSFGAQFIFQYHPNAEVIAATDLVPERCAKLAKEVGAKRTYPSAEEMIDKEKELDAVFIATDAPSHASLAVRALKRDLHVASCVPAFFGWDQRELAQEIFELAQSTGLVYSMFETSAYREPVHAMRKIYEVGGFGEVVYAEGEYYHFINATNPLDSWKGWREGLPPMWYPTHAIGYYTCSTRKRLTEVTCIGTPGILDPFKGGANIYRNEFGTEIGLFRMETGGSMRVGVSWDLPYYRGEFGRFWGQKGNYRNDRYAGSEGALVKRTDTLVPTLPESFKNNPYHHGGSHGYLTDDFLRAVLTGSRPVMDLAMSLNTTMPGVIAHRSAQLGGKTLAIPLFA